MIVTRFNPSATGNLHIGHLMTLLINEQFAHQNDGYFIVRFDDTTPPMLPKQIEKIILDQKEILKWLNIQMDAWETESELLSEVRNRLDKLGHVYVNDFGYHELPIYTRFINTTWTAFPYVPQQTAERVVMDNMSKVTHVIRGEEFALEYSLYRYYCDKFKFPAPKFVFLPRLEGRRGDISKTAGGYSIAELRGDGYTAQDIKDMLAKACLSCPQNGWYLYNLKREPRIDL